MDWLRRNWPDLLIGVALVAVIAGIIATLISGGSFFPFGQGGTTTTTPPTQPSTPITGTTTPGAPQAGTAQPGATQPGVTQPGATTPAEPGAATDPSTDPTTETTPETPASPEGIAVLPPTGTAGPAGSGAAGSGTGATTGGTTGGTTSGTTGGVTALPPSGSATPGGTASTPSTAPATPSATSPSTASPSTPTPSTATQSPTGTPVAASASTEEASYRVSVGAFGNADNAQRLAQQFQGAGYPVLLGTQGNLTIVLLGPYASDSEARRVADQVDGTFGIVDPTVYRFEPDDGVAATTAPASTTPAAPTATPAATPAPPAASASGRYLQVGAYANRESSLPQRQRLEAIGFTVTEVEEGELLKLLVGPYQGAALSDAQSRLATEGIENFARGL